MHMSFLAVMHHMLHLKPPLIPLNVPFIKAIENVCQENVFYCLRGITVIIWRSAYLRHCIASMLAKCVT